MTQTVLSRLPVRSLLCVLAALTVAGCASDPGRRGPPRDGGEPGRERGRAANVFISPMGEPFRAGPEDPYPVAVWFARANASGDGRLTDTEFVADAERFFKQLDTNHDGVIDGFEIQDYERDVAPELQPKIRGLRPGEGMDDSLKFDDREGQNSPRRRGGGPRGGQGPGGQDPDIVAADLLRQGAGLYGLLPDPEPVASASSELNGKVSLAEWREAAHRRFARLLQPGRSALTLTDLPKTPAQTVVERRRRDDHKPPPKAP